MTDKSDQIYSTPHLELKPFKFDDKVATVFQDMISRSVPGYQQILELIPTLVRHFKQVNGDYYDLGCSLGAGMIALAQGSGKQNRRIIGIDNSDAMLTQAGEYLADLKSELADNAAQFNLLKKDIQNCEINDAAIVLMNFTLQFVPLDARDSLVQKIYDGLNKGGAVVLSEKLSFTDTLVNQTLTNIHHQYKLDQGYSDLEISQKRDAIEEVLVPESLDQHKIRLRDAGFTVVTPWIQNLQFVSLLAIK